MTRFLNRLVGSLVTLLGAAVLSFVLMNAVPGDVARVVAGPKASLEVVREVRARLRLDEPWWKRLGLHLGRLARGDLGRSYVTDQPVAGAILARLPTTAALAVTAVAMWMLVAVPLGALTARFRGSRFDRATLVVATVSLSLPAFWLARMLQYWLAFKAGWFPVAGFRSAWHLVLPGAALAILYAGYYARLIHIHMCEVLDSPYIRAARAKGCPESRVLFKHALRNAMIPVVTVLGMDMAGMLGGVLFVENVFALPGIGTLAVQSVFNLDPPMIMGTVMFGAASVVCANWVVDIAYRWIDPRIKATG